MSRVFFAMLVLVVPAVTLLTTAGCEEKTVTVQQTEQRCESEPQMVSPGEEVIE